MALFLAGVGTAQADYIFTTIDVPNALGGTTAHGINDAGQIVGTYIDGHGLAHGFLDSGGRYTALDVPGVSNSGTDAYGINNAGQIVGSVRPYNIRAPVSGYLFEGGNYTLLNVPGAYSTFGYGINGAGQIVGSSSPNNSGLGPGFLLSGGTYTTVSNGAYYTEPHGINNAGQIVRDSSTDGFLLSGGKFTTIHVPGSQDLTAPTGINDAGQIVG
jgi:uncharacterized membrane protein